MFLKKIKIKKNMEVISFPDYIILKNKNTNDYMYLYNTYNILLNTLYTIKVKYNSLTHSIDIANKIKNPLMLYQFRTFYLDISNKIKQLSMCSKLSINIMEKYKKIFSIQNNLNLEFENNILLIQNKEDNKKQIKVILPSFFDYVFYENKLKININELYIKYQISKAVFNTVTTKLVHQLKGVSELYRGVINIQGLGYSVAVTKLQNSKYNLFFRFGFKDKFNYIMPTNIVIENPDTAKTKLFINTFSLELLKQTQLNIQRFRYPKAYKLQGIYLNDNFPKVKKFVK